MKIIIASSNTGGHIFPAMSLAQRLRQKNFQIYFVTDKGRTESKIPEAEFNLNTISATRMNFSSVIVFLKSVINLIKSFFESVKLIKNIQPDVVIGFGGYATFALIVAAGICKKPVIIHEQNVLPGRVNKLVSVFAKKIAVSFKETKKYFNPRKVIVSGCPVRQDLLGIGKEAAFREFNLSPDKFTILVMGGSQGSQKINSEFIKSISTIEDTSKFQIIHLTGKRDLDFARKIYKEAGISCYCVDFLEKMGYAYSMADLAISRAGGSSLAELISFKIPSVLIPYPFAYNHQMANASVLAENGASVIIEEKDLSAQKLKSVLTKLLNNKNTIREMKEAFDRIDVYDAAENLAQVVMACAKDV